ncbi:Probable RNA-directed DNA polymerase from transposon X-element [Eumeta japonica]|uniref:Probable RNA-directed DNA polymerase from transposon X-element n=1 Tax=Eumeta variegata TaxID=151549 RepID=A0A4C1T533_EUMVA|nr:Probable RNA-directed DNA polymerase from transposon X-element [Eumeta japonica]
MSRPIWKEPEVISIYKAAFKARELPASYRPISFLSGRSKLFEKILKTRLSNHFLSKGLIIDGQFGFRPIYSCSQQTLRLVEFITEDFKTKQKTIALFFDVAKAFHRVWHAGLIKLHVLKLPDRLLHIIHNYISNEYFVFGHESTYSTKQLIRARVPRGSIFSPLLYSAKDIRRPTSDIQLTLFAKHTTLYFRARYKKSTHLHFQSVIDELSRWTLED